MADLSLTAIESQVQVVEGPQPFVVGETLRLAIAYPWLTSVSSPANAIYKEDTTTDLSSTLLAGSTTATSNTVTTKQISGLSKGERYILVITCTDPNSNIIVRKVKLFAQGAGDAH